MLLRTKLSLYGVIIVLVVNLLIVYAAFQREDLIRNQFSEQTIRDQTNIWDQLVANSIEQMENNASVILENKRLADALAASDPEAIHRIATEIINRLKEASIADRFDVLNRDGSLAFSSDSGLYQSPIIRTVAVRTALLSRSTVAGIGNDNQRNIAVVFGAPLRASNGNFVGMGVLASDIKVTLAELERVNDTHVVLVNRRGRLLTTPSGEDIWLQHKDNIDLDELSKSQSVSDSDSFYSVSVLPQDSNLGNLVGRLVTIKDVTHLVLEQRQVGIITATMIIGFLLLSMIGLYVYMRRSLIPLNEGVNVLNALSKGDLEIQIEHSAGNDEVGQIANAVTVFRNSMLSFFRYRRSQERQRARQERFIHREMKQLIDTLDEGEDRDALQNELDDLGAKVHQRTTIDPNQFALMQFDSDENRQSQNSDTLALIATAFHGMSNRVRDQHDRLKEALATKEALIALRSELDIARRVQLSLLPGHIRKSDAFDIAGGMWPAKEVGGDFLDYFRLDNHRIALAIADVSGKGVPAALFTVMARTLLRNTAERTGSPGKVLESVNNFLEKNNSEELFVTYFYGILDEYTGIFTYTNCGHNPPIVRDGNKARFLPTTNGMVLAMFGELEFEDADVQLTNDSRIVLFTDGITEALNSQGELYGEDRLLQAVINLPNQSPNEDVKCLVDDVNEFVAEAPQFDDIACVVLQYKGTASQSVSDPEHEKSSEELSSLGLTVQPDLIELARVTIEIETFAEQNNWPLGCASTVMLALDELITNTVNYGFEDEANKSDIQITLTQTDDMLTVVLEDKGIAFNPFTETVEPDIDAPIEERDIGGLGVHFVKTLMDDTHYERRDDTNRITFSKSLKNERN